MTICLMLTSTLFTIPWLKFWKKKKYIQSILYYCLATSSLLYHSKIKSHRKKIEIVDKSLAHGLMTVYTGIGISKEMYYTAASTIGISVFYTIRKRYKIDGDSHCIVHIFSMLAIVRYINKQL